MIAAVILAMCVIFGLTNGASWVPPCSAQGNCVSAFECYACADTEFQVFSNGVAGYPAVRQCSARVDNCLYCWKNRYTVTYADGWTSDFQYKSCVPFPAAATCTGTSCPGQYAYYQTDHCHQYTEQKTQTACLDGTWCMKTTTECTCSSPLCNLGARIQLHNLLTTALALIFLVLLVRKCCTVFWVFTSSWLSILCLSISSHTRLILDALVWDFACTTPELLLVTSRHRSHFFAPLFGSAAIVASARVASCQRGPRAEQFFSLRRFGTFQFIYKLFKTAFSK